MVARTVLVVDDDPDIADYLTVVLEDSGYRVDTAGDVRAALASLQASLPDVVLIDVMMPGRSGLDLLLTIRSDPALAHLPLVVVTGNDQVLEDDCRSYLASHLGVRGPDGVLGKPVDRGALLEALERFETVAGDCRGAPRRRHGGAASG